MKKITISTTTSKEKYEAFLTIISGIANLTKKEIAILSELHAVDAFPLESASIKQAVADKLKINYKTLNIFLRNLVKKELLISDKWGKYELSKILKYSDKLEITIS